MLSCPLSKDLIAVLLQSYLALILYECPKFGLLIKIIEFSFQIMVSFVPILTRKENFIGKKIIS